MLITSRSNGVAVTCKTGPDSYKKHFVTLTGHVTVFTEQVDGAYANPYHYKVTFSPQSIVADWDLRGSTDALKNAVTPDDGS